MFKKLLQIFVAVFMLAVLLAACSSEPTAEDVYWDYYQACSESKYGTASDYLSDSAREEAVQVGVCGFVHETINLIELSRGGPEHTFVEEPELETEGDAARMIWIDDQGFITILLFVRVDGSWLINDIIWST